MNLSFSPDDDAFRCEGWPLYERYDACNESGGLGWLPGSEAYGYSFTALSDGHVLVRMTAAGVTPLDHTILFGQYPNAKAPLVLGNEGAGIVEGGGTVEYPTQGCLSRI